MMGTPAAHRSARELIDETTVGSSRGSAALLTIVEP